MINELTNQILVVTLKYKSKFCDVMILPKEVRLFKAKRQIKTKAVAVNNLFFLFNKQKPCKASIVGIIPMLISFSVSRRIIFGGPLSHGIKREIKNSFLESQIGNVSLVIEINFLVVSPNQ